MEINTSKNKRFFLLLLLILFVSQANIFANKGLSDNAEINLITCAPGKQVYAAFGHSAIHVKDIERNINIVFNYGTFDFNTPNFYIKFASGELDYMLSISSYDSFMEYYQQENRSVYSQKLQLDNDEKQELFNALVDNYNLENRFYRYDFFLDNCATKIDDIIKISLRTNWKTIVKPTIPYTYRTAINEYLQEDRWTLLGLNILLGSPTDKEPKELFLPYILQQNYSKITYREYPLTLPIETLYKSKNKGAVFNIPSPRVTFYTLAFVLLIASIFAPRKLRFLDFFLFLSLGIVGIAMTYTSFFSAYMATHQNWNILWAIPTHLIVAFILLFRRKKSHFIRIYFTVNVLLVSIMLTLSFFPKLFEIFCQTPLSFPFSELIPLLLCILIRSLGLLQRN